MFTLVAQLDASQYWKSNISITSEIENSIFIEITSQVLPHKSITNVS